MGKIVKIAAFGFLGAKRPELVIAVALSSMGVPPQIAFAAASAAVAIGNSLLSSPPSAEKPPALNFRQTIGNSWIIIGKRRAGGQLVFFHPRKSGSDHYRYFIFAAAGHRCNARTKWYLNDEEVTVDGAGKVLTGTYANNAWLWFGRGDYEADETPASWRSETDGKWSTDHVGYGVAKIYAKFKMTEAIVTAGMPTISAEIEGSDEIVDPRTGVAGYTDLATPAFYWWMRLPREDGGFGASADEIPGDDLLSAWTNICDEDVPLDAGGTEKRYTLNALIETGAEPSKIRKTMELCCAATAASIGGVYHTRPGYWVPPSATLDERDLTGGIGIPLLGDPQAVATEVSGTYIDPETLYQPQPIPTRSVAEDDIRQASFDLAHITSHTRGQRILEILLRRARCERRASWPMNIVGLELTAMQTVQLGTARYSLDEYAFVIDDWSLAQDFGVGLQLREENAAVYHWTADMELPKSGSAAPVTAEPIEVEAPDAPLLADWSLAGVTLTTGSGSLPALRVTSAGTADVSRLTGIQFEYRTAANQRLREASGWRLREDGGRRVLESSTAGAWNGATLEGPETAIKEIIVAPGASYEMAIRYQNSAGLSARLVLGPVIAGELETV